MRLVALAVSVLATSCGSGGRGAVPVERTTIPPGAVAACAGIAIGAGEVGEVAAHAGLSPLEATALLASDARFARAAHDRGLDAAPRVSAATRAALARSLLHDLRDPADAPPFTAAELDRVRRDHPDAFDHADSMTVIHAVARATPDDPPDKRAAAASVAAAISAATLGSHGSADFESRAKAVPHDGVEVIVELLPAFDATGRMPSTGSSLDPDFTAAAWKLTRPDEQSSPVTSAFGAHVIHLLERVPAHHASDSEIVAVAGEELRANRARTSLDELLATAHARTPISIERDATELLHVLDAVKP